MIDIKNKTLCEELEREKDNGYLHYHAPRYEFLLRTIEKYKRTDSSILDVGRSPFSRIAFRALNINIDNLGFEDDQITDTGYNFNFDLNKCQNRHEWRNDIPKYDIVIFSEVIEHLHTSPKLVLMYLNSLLKQNGVLIIQTPNAVVLHKRIQLMLGINPYNLISEDLLNPAHFREYTASELSRYCMNASFDIESLEFQNYFDYRYTIHVNSFKFQPKLSIVNVAYDLLPRAFRPGLCCVAIKRES